MAAKRERERTATALEGQPGWLDGVLRPNARIDAEYRRYYWLMNADPDTGAWDLAARVDAQLSHVPASKLW